MRRIFMLIFLLSAQPILAYAAGAGAGSSDNRPCGILVQRCLAAGFANTETPGKNVWLDCVKPIILGQPVAGVTANTTEAQACRADKIHDLKKELHELQQATSRSS